MLTRALRRHKLGGEAAEKKAKLYFNIVAHIFLDVEMDVGGEGSELGLEEVEEPNKSFIRFISFFIPFYHHLHDALCVSLMLNRKKNEPKRKAQKDDEKSSLPPPPTHEKRIRHPHRNLRLDLWENFLFYHFMNQRFHINK